MSNKKSTTVTGSTGESLINQIQLTNLPLRQKAGLLCLAGLFALPLALLPLQLAPFVGLIFLMMFAMSWDVVSGYTGQLSFGHAAFFTAGGYGSAILNVQHGVSPLVSIVIGTVLAGIVGIIVGLPALRLEGPYLSLVTLIVPLVLLKLFIVWNNSFTPFGLNLVPDGFGGRSGLSSPPQSLIGQSADAIITVPTLRWQVLGNYYLALVAMVILLSILWIITRSYTGDVLTGIREDKNAVRAVGLNPSKYKIFAFTLSATVGGFSGALYVHSMAGYPQPAELLVLSLSINVVIMSILGGTGTIVGAAVGAVFFDLTNTLLGLSALQGIELFGQSIGSLKPLPLLVLAVLVLVYLPDGLLGGGIRTGRRILSARSGEEPSFDEGSTPLQTIVGNYRENLEEMVNAISGGDRQ